LWGEARRHLEHALMAPPPPFAPPPTAVGVAAGGGPAIPDDNDRLARATPRLCLLMAQLEEAEHGDLKRTREWLDRAVHALPDPHYVCSACGAESAEWHALCPRCGAFDRLAWRTPAWTGAAAFLPVAEKSTTDALVAAPPVVLPAANPASG
jgi:HemY protein